MNLGTEVHKKKYFDDISWFRLPGCFAMTELKHGEQDQDSVVLRQATIDAKHTTFWEQIGWAVHCAHFCYTECFDMRCTDGGLAT